VLFRWKQKNGNINILQTKSCDNLADLFTKSLPYSTFSEMCWGDWYEKTQVFAKSGGVILRDIRPVLYHHITLFSLYEFCLVKVFSSKVFNEVISTKLYASSLIFPTGVFMHDDYKHICLLEFKWDSLMIQNHCVLLIFPIGFLRRSYIWRRLTDDQMKLELIKGEC
jgi:hypothetical protein